jgi:hypothetical protein
MIKTKIIKQLLCYFEIRFENGNTKIQYPQHEMHGMLNNG